MKRVIVLMGLVVMITMGSIFAAQHTAVPVGHRAYQILEVAQIRGLIENQPAVKPYSASTVISLLTKVAEQTDSLSNAEINDLNSLITELQASYGTSDSYADQLFSTGYLRTFDEEKALGAAFGITLGTQQTVSLVTKEYDSRNTVVAFMKGDIGKNVSFNMDFGLVLDKLNNRVFLPSEFTIPGEGFYMRLTEGGNPPSSIPFDKLNTSLTLSPELAVSLFDGDLLLRWGSIKRDWGPGLNNLMLSGSARSFDGIDISVNLTHWLRYSVINGSLGKFSLRDIDGQPFLSDYYGGSKEDKANYTYNNNFSAHRVELDATKNLTLSIFESTIWQKRFELSYLNPFAIYMFQQNSLGDIDDVFAGLDFSYTLPSKARLYGAMAMNEMNVVGNPVTMLKAPRNMFAFQAGLVVPIPIGSFSSMTLQWTYIGPFVYTHYPMREFTGAIDPGLLDATETEITIISDQGREFTYTQESNGDPLKITFTQKGSSEEEIDVSSGSTWYSEDGRTMIEESGGQYLIYETYAETFYVNKGENLGYPLNPNSQEILLQFDFGLSKGWTAQLQGKYQARSGQYGYEMYQYMYYPEDHLYPEKDFWGNVFNHKLSVKATGTKKFEGTPISITASYQFLSEWDRPLTNEEDVFFDGRFAKFGPWSDAELDHIVQVGVRIFF
ncbi:hypothetical protein [uncultured Sphaerochaeta sp.]|uniref:hypothetical protein n=1 Tax=uncultured Sphaerochaeta sp. TaxID=886478 RepID=UPI002A0A0F49|nr:hypothetical protein [uncultured Sphaerochaeta sp.]